MGNKPEVFLEIGAGFLRIPTSEINYTITVIGGGEHVAPAAPAPPAVAPSPPPASGPASGCVDDHFYESISNDLYRDIGELAKSLSSTITDIPAEDMKMDRATLDEAGDKIEGAKAQLRDIVKMTEQAAMAIMDSVESVQQESVNVKDLLAELKEHQAFNSTTSDAADEPEPEEGEPSLASEVTALSGQIDDLSGLIDALSSADQPAAAPEPVIEKSSRYLFDLDVIFQTLYELCTNETVKDHITDVRGKAGELFDLEGFQDKISLKAVKYKADGDNYFDVPMSDVFQSLFAVCGDKGTKNLLKKMDSGQGSIFLDQAIPLEAPEIVEVEHQVEGEATPDATSASVDTAPLVDQLALVKDALARVTDLAQNGAPAGGAPAMTAADQQEIFAKIEAAFDVSASITTDVSKITEALSFQDLSGQQILKIIKLLSDFQVQLLAIVVSFGSQLKHKTENADLSVEESKKIAKEDVGKYIGDVPQDGTGGMLDQDMVNTMLADFGFD